MSQGVWEGLGQYILSPGGRGSAYAKASDFALPELRRDKSAGQAEVRGRLNSRSFSSPRFFVTWPGCLVFVLGILFVLPVKGFAAETGVEGTVRSAGAGAAGVYVEVFNRLPDGSVSPVATTTSGENGKFTLQLPRGDYYITARKRPSGTSSVGMLFGSSGKEPVSVSVGLKAVPPIDLDDQGGLGSLDGNGVDIRGYASHGGSGLGGAFVYIYPGSQRRGPGYLAKVRTAEDGAFRMKIPTGVYSVTVRNSPGGDGMGSVQKGDLVGEYTGNPIHVGQNPVMIGTVQLREVDILVWEKSRWALEEGPLSVRGTVYNEEGRPVAGVYAFLYMDHRMVGKPTAISSPTDTDGTYEVRVQEPGSYYLGARSRYGGPVEPGELMGAYDSDGIQPVKLDHGKPVPDCDIVVREVW